MGGDNSSRWCLVTTFCCVNSSQCHLIPLVRVWLDMAVISSRWDPIPYYLRSILPMVEPVSPGWYGATFLIPGTCVPLLGTRHNLVPSGKPFLKERTTFLNPSSTTQLAWELCNYGLSVICVPTQIFLSPSARLAVTG